MNIFRRILIFFVPCIQSVLLYYSLSVGKNFWWVALAGFIITDIGLSLMISKHAERRRIFIVSLPSIGLILSSFGVLFILENDLLKNTVIVLNALLQFIYFLNMYYYFHRTHYYQERSLYHINGILQTVIFFYLSCLFFGLHAYVDISYWYELLPYSAIVILFLLQYLVLHGVDSKYRIIVVAAWSIIHLELIYAVQYLPTPYYINAFVITVFYYAYSNLGVSALQKEISRRQITTYALLCGGIIALLLFISL